MSTGAGRTRGRVIESRLETLDAIVRHTARDLKLSFIDCDDERLERRYTETRPLIS